MPRKRTCPTCPAPSPAPGKGNVPHVPRPYRGHVARHVASELVQKAQRAPSLGRDERAVVGLIQSRLGLGAKTYGVLDVAGDPRDWTQEALEEALDLAVYLAAALLRRGPRNVSQSPNEGTTEQRGARRARRTAMPTREQEAPTKRDEAFAAKMKGVAQAGRAAAPGAPGGPPDERAALLLASATLCESAAKLLRRAASQPSFRATSLALAKRALAEVATTIEACETASGA